MARPGKLGLQYVNFWETNHGIKVPKFINLQTWHRKLWQLQRCG